MRQELAEAAELMICIGSSLAVYPVASLPALTLERGGQLAIVTKGPTPYDSDADAQARRRGRRGATGAVDGVGLAAPAAALLPAGSEPDALRLAVGDDRFGTGAAEVRRVGADPDRFPAAGADRFGANDAGDRPT